MLCHWTVQLLQSNEFSKISRWINRCRPTLLVVSIITMTHVHSDDIPVLVCTVVAVMADCGDAALYTVRTIRVSSTSSPAITSTTNTIECYKTCRESGERMERDNNLMINTE